MEYTHTVILSMKIAKVISITLMRVLLIMIYKELKFIMICVTTGEIIINGTNDLSVTTEVDYKFYRERIIGLTENEMTIEVEFQFNDSDVIENKIIELFKTPLL